MAHRSFSNATEEMSTSRSSGSGALAQPVYSIESEEKQTYRFASESCSESSVRGNWGTEGMDLYQSVQSEVPGEENLIVLTRTTQSLEEDLEKELQLQQSHFLSIDHQNVMAHPLEVNMEKAFGISTRLSNCMKLMEERIKNMQHQSETDLHNSVMARKEAERATKDAQAQLDLLKLEHGQTLLSMQSEYKDRCQELEAELAAEKIKSTALEKHLKEVEALLLAKMDVNAELDAKLQDMESRHKELEIMKSIAERRSQGEPKRRKKALKAALDSAEADLPQKVDSFKKMYLKSALDILKRHYSNLDFSMIENGDLLGSDNMDFVNPQRSRIAPNVPEENTYEPERVRTQGNQKRIQPSESSGLLCQKYRVV